MSSVFKEKDSGEAMDALFMNLNTITKNTRQSSFGQGSLRGKSKP
jgi:hypothetical protein